MDFKSCKTFNEMGDFGLNTNFLCIFWESFKFKGQNGGRGLGVAS